MRCLEGKGTLSGLEKAYDFKNERHVEVFKACLNA
jgi:hypothetical protein